MAVIIVISVKFKSSSYSINEEKTGKLILVLSDPSSTDIILKVNTSDITATGMCSLEVTIITDYDVTGGDDYVRGPYTVTFPAGVVESSFNVDIIDDTILERNETFELSINSSTLPNRVRANDPSKVIVTIMDNDGKFY